MPRLLRATEGARWDFDLPGWLEREDLPAAPFGDLRPSPTGKLSVWMIDDDASNLDRVIAGMAANRPNLAKFDCTLIDRAVVDDMGVELRKEPGNSKDRGPTGSGTTTWWTSAS